MKNTRSMTNFNEKYQTKYNINFNPEQSSETIKEDNKEKLNFLKTK